MRAHSCVFLLQYASGHCYSKKYSHSAFLLKETTKQYTFPDFNHSSVNLAFFISGPYHLRQKLIKDGGDIIHRALYGYRPQCCTGSSASLSRVDSAAVDLNRSALWVLFTSKAFGPDKAFHCINSSGQREAVLVNRKLSKPSIKLFLLKRWEFSSAVNFISWMKLFFPS